MEFEELSNIEEKSYVLLCKQCLDQDEYLIPTYELNSFNEVQYKCPKNHITGKNDIFLIVLDEETKRRLTHCNDEDHICLGLDEETVFGAWCEECKKNLCELDISNNTGHNFLPYKNIMPDDQVKLKLKEKLEKLKVLIDKYTLFYSNEKETKKYLIKTYNRNFMNYNLFYNEKIVNYQTCLNILFNNNDDFKENSFELYEDNLNKKEYISIYQDILNTKQLDKINAKILKRKFLGKEIIIPLLKEGNNKNAKNEIYFAIFMDFLEGKALFIYDIFKNVINKIELKENKNYNIMKYQNDIIIIYDNSALNIIYFSKNYKNHNLLKLNINYQNKKLSSINQRIKTMGYYFELFMKLLETSSYKLLFLYNYKAYSLDLEKYLNGKINYTISNENLELLLPDSNYALNANNIYYKYNDFILEGVILISFSIEKTKLEITMLDENLEKKILQFDSNFNLSEGKTYTVFDINYNYLNNMISLFINHEIYLLNPTTRQVSTIYDISLYLNGPDDFNYSFSKNIKAAEVFSFYYYNEENKKMEQAILLMNNTMKETYQFFWDEKYILLKKKYNPINNIKIMPIISPFVLANLNEEGNYDKIYKVNNFIIGIIRVDSDKLVLIW